MEEASAAARIDIQCELTIFTAAALRQRLLEVLAGTAELTVDLSRVTEIDSAGIQLMIAAQREAAERGRVLRFTGQDAAVIDLLELCGLAALLGDPARLHAGT
jgi:anti-anti-sigma factor